MYSAPLNTLEGRLDQSGLTRCENTSSITLGTALSELPQPFYLYSILHIFPSAPPDAALICQSAGGGIFVSGSNSLEFERQTPGIFFEAS
jgi:hypothetical protein